MKTITIDSKKREKIKETLNGEGKKESFSFERFLPPSYEEIMSEIRNKIGERGPVPDDLDDPNFSNQALKVLEERYLVKAEDGKVKETPREMLWRVAWEIASAEARFGGKRGLVEKKARDFYSLMASKRFLPNSPTLMNAGTGNMLQYSACFVLPVEDSMEGIFDALKWQALIHKSGGGTGFSFSRLRPRGSMVKSSKGVASGPVSFMKIFDAATNEVKQGGKRRGANMGILRVDHPDILEFIHCKEDGGITNFNISVAITDKFMEAWENDDFYELIDPHTGKIVQSLKAREVFDEIVQAAWRTGDPGLVFIDRINKGKANPVKELGPIEATNPCGEQPLYPFDACNLGSIFLSYFVDEQKNDVDWEGLKNTVHLAIRFLDNVIEVNPYPLENIRKTVFAIRRIGLGVGGWADMLVKLRIRYDSEEALQLAGKVMETIQNEAVLASKMLAKRRGPFPLWPISIYKDEKEPRRNATVTTIAPTGTISIIADTSSGIEPLFAIAYQHKVKDKFLERTLSFINPYFEEWGKKQGFLDEMLKEEVVKKGTIGDIEKIPEEVRMVFRTAHEIDYSWHVRMQAVFQRYTENAVSKTINLPHDASVEDVKNAYLLAWKEGCNGITIFRDGSKKEQVLNLGIKKEGEVERKEKIIERPLRALGATYKLHTPVGTAFITINEDEKGDPLEIFINVGKAGSDVTAMAEALGRTISTAFRTTGQMTPKEKVKELIHQLAGIGGRRSVGFGSNKVLSLPDAVAYALSLHFNLRLNGDNFDEVNQKEGESKIIAGEDDNKNPEVSVRDICPSCGAFTFVYEEGCSKCLSCGYSEC